jgi:hypothetical protein
VHHRIENVEKNPGEYEDEKPSSPLMPKFSLSSEKGESIIWNCNLHAFMRVQPA